MHAQPAKTPTPQQQAMSVSALNVSSADDKHLILSLLSALLFLSLLAINKPAFASSEQALTSVWIDGFQTNDIKPPPYPAAALQSAIEGYVAVQFDLDISGFAQNVRVLEAKPRNWFEASVMDSIKSHRFTPEQVNGETVTILGAMQRYTFKLNTVATKQNRPIIVDSLSADKCLASTCYDLASRNF